MVTKVKCSGERLFFGCALLIPVLALTALLLFLLPPIDHAIAADKNDDKNRGIPALLEQMKGIDTDKLDSIINDFEKMPVEQLKLKELEWHLKWVQQHSELCKENYRRIQQLTDIHHLSALPPRAQYAVRSAAYISAMHGLAAERDKKLEEIKGRETKAYRDKYGHRYPMWNDSRWPKDRQYEKFRREEMEVNEWFITRSKEITESAKLGNPQLSQLIDKYREEVKRQCLFIGNAIHRVQRLIDIKKGIRPVEVEVKEEVKKEAKREYIEIHCDREEIFEDEVANCTAWLYIRGRRAAPVRQDTGKFSWTPAVVKNGFVYGQDVKKKHTLPYTFDVEATYTPWGEKESFQATISLTVKQRPTKPAISLRVSVDYSGHVNPGDLVKYTYDITNTGDVPLTDLGITDDQCPKLGIKSKTLKIDPKETMTMVCHIARHSDTTSHIVVEGKGPNGKLVTAKADITVKVQGSKTASGGCPPPKIRTPYVLYLTEDEAKKELGAVGLIGRVGKKVHSDTVAAGKVIDQNPYEQCVENKTVYLVISLGPKPEETVAEAQAKLQAHLDCGGAFELAPGGFTGKDCNVIVKGWRSKTGDRVEVKIEYDKKSGIAVTPGNQSAPPSLMYTPGAVRASDVGRYVFFEGFRARRDAKEGVTPVTITVRQKGAGEVRLALNISVLPPGLTPSGEGIRPPATVSTGSGGEFCVWRKKISANPDPRCFEFAKAGCNSQFYNNPGNGWELVGINVEWDEGTGLIQRLKREYGCGSIAQVDKQDEPGKKDPSERPVDQGSEPEKDPEDKTIGGDEPPTGGRVLTRFGISGPATCVVKEKGQSCAYSAVGEFSDQPGKYVSVTAQWPNGSVISPSGPGTYLIVANYQGASDEIEVTVDWRVKEAPEQSGSTDQPQGESEEGDETAEGGPEKDGKGPKTVTDCDPTDPLGDCYDPTAEKKPIFTAGLDPGVKEEVEKGETEFQGPEKGSSGDGNGGKQPVTTQPGTYTETPEETGEKGPKEQLPTEHAPGSAGTLEGPSGETMPTWEGQVGKIPQATAKPRPSPTPTTQTRPPQTARAPAAGPTPGGGLTNVTVNVTPTKMTVWDYSREDLDRVRIALNGSTVTSNLTIRNAKQEITLYLREGVNTLAVTALNIGDPELQKKWRLSPYNSAAIEIQGVTVGRKSQQWKLSQGQTGTMQITYQPR